MNEQKPDADEPAFLGLKSGDSWGESIYVKRSAKLEEALRRWEQQEESGKLKGPFDQIELTGADVFWLAARSLAGPTGDMPQQAERLLTARSLFAKYVAHGLQDYDDFDLFDAIGNVMNGASLDELHLEGSRLGGAHLEGAYLEGAHLEGAWFVTIDGDATIAAHLEMADLVETHLEGAWLMNAHVEAAHFGEANLERAVLSGAHLAGANFHAAHLEGAILHVTDLAGKAMSIDELDRLREIAPEFPEVLPSASLQYAYLSRTGNLLNMRLADKHRVGPWLAGVSWDGANLTVADWSTMEIIGEEWMALRKRKALDGQKKPIKRRIGEYEEAVRAYRLLSIALRGQGLNEHADRFSYRAQVLQRGVSRLRKRYAAAFGSWLLDLISGYGYKPMRSVIAYIVIILAFAGAYLLNAQFAAPHLTWDEALVLSISSFHGRGFFTTSITLGNNLARIAAGEAIIGLLLEITFIATFTQRFFAR